MDMVVRESSRGTDVVQYEHTEQPKLKRTLLKFHQRVVARSIGRMVDMIRENCGMTMHHADPEVGKTRLSLAAS